MAGTAGVGEGLMGSGGVELYSSMKTQLLAKTVIFTPYLSGISSLGATHVVLPGGFPLMSFFGTGATLASVIARNGVAMCPAIVGVGRELAWSLIGRGVGAIVRGVGAFERSKLASERCKFHACCGELGGLLFYLGVLRGVGFGEAGDCALV
jgi:hypothetical protein